MINSQQFRRDYDDFTSDVKRATYKNFKLRLMDWLEFLDGSAESAPYMAYLKEGFTFDQWYDEALATAGGMVGSGDLGLSRDRTERLKQYLGLVRRLAADQQELADFSSKFMWAGSKLDANVSKLADELFAPFARDLLKFMERTDLTDLKDSQFPASDRVVTINHNAPEIQDIAAKLEEVERHMQESNSLKREEDYDRNLAEISAGRRLLQASKVRVAALQEVLVPALKWLAAQVGGVVMGALVTALLIAIASMFGIVIPGLG